ncbi:MAG: hypothetical protein PHE13_05690, partial [Bacteroidales bacterium]|nr:hypothetical protein [Bacteroidales bacterium]
MKTLLSISCFLLLSTINIISYSQNITASDITHNSAIISFPNASGESLNLHVFTKSVDDTIIYAENFSRLPKVYMGNDICSSAIALNLPPSYTNISGCKGKNLYNKNGDSCSFNNGGEFITPFIDLSKSSGNYRIKFSITNNNSSKKSIYIYKSDLDGNYSNYSSVTINGNSSFAYDSLYTGGTSKARIKFYSPSTYITIDNLSISYTSTTKTPINLSPYNTSSNSINLTSLNSNIIYYCFIEGRTDTISFKTLDKILLDSIYAINPNSLRINFSSTDTVSVRKLIVKKKSTYQNVFSDDLFISEYTTAHSSNRAIEIYNGTGLDMCLKDYSIYINIFSGASNIDTTFNFSQYDTIKSNSCIVFMVQLQNINIANNGYFYKQHRINGSSHIIDGNDAIAIKKDGNYID